MEMIILSVLLGVAIITMGVVFTVHIITTGRNTRELQKLVKSDSLQEFSMFEEAPEEEEEEEPDIVPLEDMEGIMSQSIRGE